jgi:catechol 2,3-dioxygenase-like lactoylglutathione lyase family enzyme
VRLGNRLSVPKRDCCLNSQNVRDIAELESRTARARRAVVGVTDIDQGEFMINYAVDDMDAFLSRLHAKGVAILKRDDGDPNGRFA